MSCMCKDHACGYVNPAACKPPRLTVPGPIVLAFLASRLVSQPLFAGAVFQQLVWRVVCGCQMVAGNSFLVPCFGFIARMTVKAYFEKVRHIWKGTSDLQATLCFSTNWLTGGTLLTGHATSTDWSSLGGSLWWCSLQQFWHHASFVVQSQLRRGQSWCWVAGCSWSLQERTGRCFAMGCLWVHNGKQSLLPSGNYIERLTRVHGVYSQPEDRLGWTLPFLYHGDEGRGRLRRAVLICSYQPLLFCSGHSFKSRLLASVFPGERYACVEGEETLEALHDAVAAGPCGTSLRMALRWGYSFCVACLYFCGDKLCGPCFFGYCTALKVCLPDGSSQQIHIAFCGVKGDWPWQSFCVAKDGSQHHIPRDCCLRFWCACVFFPLQCTRKVHRLETGFQSKRVCQYCQSQAGVSIDLVPDHTSLWPKIDMNRTLILQDWWCTALTAQWRRQRPGDWPSKLDRPAKIHTVPGMGPTDAPPDQMHTWHLGVGQYCMWSNCSSLFCIFPTKPKLASACQHCSRSRHLIAHREVQGVTCLPLQWFGGTTRETQLENAFQNFNTWKMQ